jgi:hypothetical protein
LKIRKAIMQELETLAIADSCLTCTQLCKRLKMRSDTVSTTLRRMVVKGDVVRVDRYGPRGGYGYRLPTLTEILTRHSVKQLTEDIDQQVIADLMQVRFR